MTVCWLGNCLCAEVTLLGPTQASGHDMQFTSMTCRSALQGSQEFSHKSKMVRVGQEQQEVVFTDVGSEPVPSLLRDFSLAHSDGFRGPN